MKHKARSYQENKKAQHMLGFLEQNEEERRMRNEERKIAITIEEIEGDKFRLDLGEFGEFTCIYLIPERRGIFGRWQPSRKLEEKLGQFLGKQPYMTTLYYVVAESDRERENDLIYSEDAKLTDFVALKWDNWHLGDRERAEWLV